MIPFKTNRFEKLNLIWIHIPKNASTTFRSWINLQYGLPPLFKMGDIKSWKFSNGQEVQNPNHDRLWHAIFNDKLGTIEEFKKSKCTKILILRNPYDRFASAIADKYFSFPNKIENPGIHHIKRIGISKNPMDVTLLEIAQHMQGMNTLLYNQHWIPQRVFYRPFKLEEFDYLFSVKDFTKQFNSFCEKQGFNKLKEYKQERKTHYKDKQINKNISTLSIKTIRNKYKIPSKEQILSPAIKKIVKEIYKEDFEFYNQMKEINNGS